MKHDLFHVASQFHIPGEVISAEPYGTGHVNDTYAVSCRQGDQTVRYIFQRINPVSK